MATITLKGKPKAPAKTRNADGERRAPLRERPLQVALVAQGQQVEGHEVRRRLLGQQVDP